MDLIQQEYARPKYFMTKYAISRPTLWRLTQEMKQRPKFEKAFRKLSRGVELINIKQFDDYMLTRTQEIEKEG